MSIADLATWLLDKDIRAKNALSCLLGLVGVVAFYLSSRRTEWFADIEKLGIIAVGVALLIVFLISFLTVWLIWTAIAAKRRKVVAIKQAQDAAERRERQILDNLHKLSDWQRSLLFRFAEQNQRHFEEFEIGGYKAVWGADVYMLVSKGVLIQHRGGIYAIDAEHFDCLRYIIELETGVDPTNRPK